MSQLKNIAIVELESHNEVLRAYLLVLLEMDYQVLCLTTLFNYKQLVDLHGNPKIDFVLKEKSDTYLDFFESNRERLSVCDRAIVTTIPLRDSFFNTYHFPCKSIYVVHKYHSYFSPSDNIKISSLKDSWRMIKGKLAGYSDMYLTAISNFSAFVMPSDFSFNYAKSKNKHGDNKLLGSLDFAINELKSEKQNNTFTQIVIPGTIGLKSRDYLPVINAFKKIKDQINSKIEIHLLGRPMGAYGEKMIALCKSLETENLKFSFYRDFIIQSEFDKIMLKADFLILPIAEYMKFDIFQEKNGYSCVSGNMNDMIKYGLPSILPSYYPIDQRLEEMVSRYQSSEDLGGILLEWLENKKYNDIKEQTDRILEPYHPKEMSIKFGRVLEQIV